MKLSNIFLLLGAFCFAAVSCKSSRELADEEKDLKGSQSAPDPRATLRVTVTAADTGAPVPEFRLQVTDRPPQYAHLTNAIQKVSDPDGRFIFRGLPPGNFNLGVKARDYTTFWEAVKLEEGQTKDVGVKLDRGANVLVKVINAETGELIRGAKVEYLSMSKPRVFYHADLEDSHLLDIYRSFRTDANGLCKIESLDKERYNLSASHPDYYGEQNVSIEATIPQDAGKEFVIRLRRAGTLQGTITNFSKADFLKTPYRLVLDQARTDDLVLQYEIAINSSDGTFYAQRVEPATYKILFTTKEHEKETIEDRKHMPQLETVEVQSGKAAKVAVTVP